MLLSNNSIINNINAKYSQLVMAFVFQMVQVIFKEAEPGWGVLIKSATQGPLFGGTRTIPDGCSQNTSFIKKKFQLIFIRMLL